MSSPTMPSAEPKSWRASLTIVGTLIATLTSWAMQMGFVSAEEAELTQTLLSSAAITVEHLFAVVAVYGLRRAVAPISGPGAGTVAASAVGLVALIAVGCATYDRVRVTASADAFTVVDEITFEECEAFEAASLQLTTGPNRTILGLGRAGDLKAISELIARQAAVCREVVARESMDPEALARVQSAFDATWAHAREAVN